MAVGIQPGHQIHADTFTYIMRTSSSSPSFLLYVTRSGAG
jgi:hypothetical protein